MLSRCRAAPRVGQRNFPQLKRNRIKRERMSGNAASRLGITDICAKLAKYGVETIGFDYFNLHVFAQFEHPLKTAFAYTTSKKIKNLR